APVPVGNVHVAGVGAVGSAFLFALASHGRATGSFDLIDPDAVDRPNLGRYVLFDVGDVLKPKVTAAKARLAAAGCAAEVRAHEARFEEYFDQQYGRDNSFRVERLVCCPDSRQARREFQSKLPFETFDASTGPSQVVVHQNTYDPSKACVECIYPRIVSEDAHAEHVARKLNVRLERVRSGQNIDADDAEQIIAAYPNLRVEDLVGRAFDSIFRNLCGAGELRVEDEVVLAPMPFTSALAGVLLYFELVKASAEALARFRSFNYVQLNPLFAPNPLMREMRGSNPTCRCQEIATRGLFNRIWGDRLDGTSATPRSILSARLFS
ncbi:MAG TPA: ThiF family adenylyltransferase, partial [Thermoanaerobaculia bacterium]